MHPERVFAIGGILVLESDATLCGHALAFGRSHARVTARAFRDCRIGSLGTIDSGFDCSGLRRVLRNCDTRHQSHEHSRHQRCKEEVSLLLNMTPDHQSRAFRFFESLHPLHSV